MEPQNKSSQVSDKKEEVVKPTQGTVTQNAEKSATQPVIQTTTQKKQQKVEKLPDQKKQQKSQEKKQQKPEEKKKQEKPQDKKKQEQNKTQAKTMKCVFLTGAKQFQVRQVPIPKPASGQILIKVMAAPINPSDLALFGGHYSLQKKYPTIMGFEGSGMVVESGGGLMGWGYVGKKVAFGAQKQGTGTYAQYIVAKCQECLPLSDDTTFEQGSMSIVNPLTAIGMLDVIKQRKQKCVVITAAASALGRMINRIYPKQGVEVINIVRKKQQVELLKSEGAKYVLDSSEENFETQLRVLSQKMGSHSCLQCVGGDFTGIVTKNMPKNSIITVYGSLSNQNVNNIDVMDLLVNNKTINSFLLNVWLATKNQLTLLPIFYKVRSAISNQLKTKVSKKFKLQQLDKAIEYYLSHMTEGKVLLEPWTQ